MTNREKIENSNYKAFVTLTVAEGKRLIAKGLMAYAPFQEGLKKRTVVITKGSTNTYIAEALLNKKITSGAFIYGHTTPEKGTKKVDRSKTIAELVLRNGKLSEENYPTIVGEMTEGDIIVKGANIINYEKQQAGVLIAHPTGGTTGVIYDAVSNKNLNLIIPIGLEKLTGQDIDEMSEISKLEIESMGPKTPYIWSLTGDIFTEIEAIKQLAQVEVLQLAAGGIGDAEGAVSLLIIGNEHEVFKAKSIIKEIQGEKPFIEA